MNIMKQAELKNYQDIIAKAKAAWDAAAKEQFALRGDTGSCIMGDGIEVEVLPPRCKYPRRIMIIPSREVSYAQGSIHYEAVKDIAINMLKEAGLNVHYNYGRMD